MNRYIAILLSSLLLFSCEKEDTGGINGTAPILPSSETMIIDFGQMVNLNKSTHTAESNWFYSASSLIIWNEILESTFAVPLACYNAASNQKATQINDLTWQWEYSVNIENSTYETRLQGMFISEQIQWRIYITKTGTDPFDEFLWFEGMSKVGRKSGEWVFYHSPDFQERMIEIGWETNGNQVGEITYSFVREKDNNGLNNEFYGSTLTYGLQNMEFNAFANIHSQNSDTDSFSDTYIEWNRSNCVGHIKAEHIFADNDWHCWDQQANNTDCN